MGLGGSNPLGDFEELTVSVKLRADALRQQLASELANTKKELEGLSNSASNAEDALNNAGTRGALAFGGIIGAVSGLVVMLGQAAQQAAAFVYNFVAQGVQMNANLQMSQIAFTNMLGSEDKAVAFMQKLRKEAALFGGDQEAIMGLGRSMLPYAKGDIAAFDQMITLAKQLSIIDPVQGFRGAGLALREAFSGNTRSLVARFELPRKELAELNKEFQKTGDMKKFLTGMQDLVGMFGATAGSIESMKDSAIGSFRMIGFQISEMQRMMGAPIFDSIQKNLGEFSKYFNANTNDLKLTAIRVGSYIAASIDIIVEGIKTVVKAIDIAVGLSSQIKTIYEGLMTMVEKWSSEILASLTETAGNAVNGLIKIFNSIAPALKMKPMELIKVDKERYKKDAEEIVHAFRKGFEKFNIADISGLGIAGKSLDVMKLLGLDVTGDFGKRVSEYEEKFKHLLDVQQFTTEEIKKGDAQFSEEELKLWEDALAKIGNEIEKYNKEIEKAAENHKEKLDSIAADAAAARTEAGSKAKEDSDAEAANYKKSEQDIIQKGNQSIEKIEKDHGDRIKQIKESAADALFDAINARDARRVYEILRGAKKEEKQANGERANQLKEAAKNRQQDLMDLSNHHNERLAEINKKLNEELRKIDKNEDKKRDDENLSYQKRLRDLHESLVARLTELGKGLADEGKITNEGLMRVMTAVASVYGPNGAYLSIIDGFNTALAIKTAQTQALLGGTVGGPTTQPLSVTNPTATATSNLMYTKGSAKVTAVASGFEGIVQHPMLFMAGEGGSPERVSVIPQGRPGFSDEGNSGGISDLHITVDARGVTAEFEAQLAAGVSKYVGDALIRSKRIRK